MPVAKCGDPGPYTVLGGALQFPFYEYSALKSSLQHLDDAEKLVRNLGGAGSGTGDVSELIRSARHGVRGAGDSPLAYGVAQLARLFFARVDLDLHQARMDLEQASSLARVVLFDQSGTGDFGGRCDDLSDGLP